MWKILFLVVSVLVSITLYAEPICESSDTCVTKPANWRQLAVAREDALTYITGPKVVPELITGSAESLIGRSWQQNMVKQWLLNNRGYAELLGGYIGFIPALLGSRLGVVTTFDAHFVDGSVATYRLSGLGRNAAIELRLVSIADAAGNKHIIKEKPKLELSATLITNVFLPIALLLSYILYRLNRTSQEPINYMLNFGLTLFLFPIGVLYFLYSVGRYLSVSDNQAQKK